MPRLQRRIVTALVLAMVVLVPLGGTAEAAPARAHVVLPASITEAQTIVSRLWELREAALANDDRSVLPRVDAGAVLELDRQYLSLVRCGCVESKAAHTIETVRIDIPPVSVQSAFFAEVKTRNTTTDEHPWYIVAVAREAGAWRIVFLTVGPDGDRPPLPVTAQSPVTAALHARMTRLAQAEARATNARAGTPTSNKVGGVESSHAKIDEPLDGVYGLAYRSGQLLSCYTLHVLDTSTSGHGSSLVQGTARAQWGHAVPPGSYRSITVDSGTPQCVLGTRTGAPTGTVVFRYEATPLAATSVPS